MAVVNGTRCFVFGDALGISGDIPSGNQQTIPPIPRRLCARRCIAVHLDGCVRFDHGNRHRGGIAGGIRGGFYAVGGVDGFCDPIDWRDACCTRRTINVLTVSTGASAICSSTAGNAQTIAAQTSVASVSARIAAAADTCRTRGAFYNAGDEVFASGNRHGRIAAIAAVTCIATVTTRAAGLRAWPQKHCVGTRFTSGAVAAGSACATVAAITRGCDYGGKCCDLFCY